METYSTMKNILNCIAEDFLWLFDLYNFRITNSVYNSSFGGQGMVELKNADIKICFVSDREKIYLEFSPIKGWPEGDVVTIDLLYEKITGKSIDSAMLTDISITFIKGHFSAVISLFTENDPKELLSAFNKMKMERAKRLFG